MSPLSFEVVERGELIVPCPLVSRGRPTYSSDTTVSSSSGASVASPSEAPWVAMQAGVGPAKLLVSWAVDSGGSRPETGQLGRSYDIETSANSTDGRDGEWRRELRVEQSSASAHAHVIEYDGQSWVRLTLSEALAGGALPFERFELHDASDGTDDCWLVLGDARVAALEPGAARRGEHGWPGLIHERYPGYFPALIDETRAGESPARTLDRLAGLLALHAPAKRVAIGYCAASLQSSDAGPQALEAMVAAVLQSGRLPVLARSPARRGGGPDAGGPIQRCVAALEQRYRLVPGPDLAAWFDAHPDQLDAEGLPNLEGCRSIARLWADAVDVWYVPQ